MDLEFDVSHERNQGMVFCLWILCERISVDIVSDIAHEIYERVHDMKGFQF